MDFRTSDFWVWFFGHGFLSYGFLYGFADSVFLDMVIGGSVTVLCGFR